MGSASILTADQIDSFKDYSLSKEELEHFDREGYLIIESFLEAAHCRRLAEEVDEAARKGGVFVSYKELGLLTSHPPLMGLVESILGPGFMMHHIHAQYFDANAQGKPWHHDYRQRPQTNRSHKMIHSLFYLSGLNGEIGDLLLLPRSHGMIVDNKAFGLFGTEDLPGCMVVDRLPAGSVVLVHSSLIHARRPKPGGEGYRRYFVDVSYCQRGILWPGHEYGGGYKAINKTALDLGLDRNGRYAHVYDSDQFFEVTEIDATLRQVNTGSLALMLDRVANRTGGAQ